MKIRRKDDHTIVAEIHGYFKKDTKIHLGGIVQQSFWYKDDHCKKIRLCYFDHEWEEVPEPPALVDVTGEVDIPDTADRRCIRIDGYSYKMLPDGYEWVKTEGIVGVTFPWLGNLRNGCMSDEVIYKSLKAKITTVLQIKKKI